MNIYQIVYKTKAITSFASCYLKAKHITLRRMLDLTIQNNIPTCTKVTS